MDVARSRVQVRIRFDGPVLPHGRLNGVFRAYASLGRVNETGDPKLPPNFSAMTHMVIFVQLDADSNITYLVDVGCGGSGPTMPILLSDDKDNIVMGTASTERHRLRKGSYSESSTGEWLAGIFSTISSLRPEQMRENGSWK
jgi:arylamine N-acetyltransferase